MRIPNIVIVAILIFGGFISLILTTGTGPKERFTLNDAQLRYLVTGATLKLTSQFVGMSGPVSDDPCSYAVTLKTEEGGNAAWVETCEGSLPGLPSVEGMGTWATSNGGLCLKMEERHRLRGCREVRIGAGGFEIINQGGEKIWTFTVTHPAHSTWEPLRDALVALTASD